MITIEQAEFYANQLVENDFLTRKGKDILLQEIKKGAIEVEHPSTVKSVSYTSAKLSKETILQFCSAALITELSSRLHENAMTIEDKISPKEPIADSSGRTYHMFDFMGSKLEYKGCISSNTSVIGYTRSKTLNTFLKVHLIDEKIFNDCATLLKSKKLRDEVDLLEYMLYRSTYYAYYEFNKKEQEEYISSLVTHGILSEEGKENLLRSYQNYELKTIPEMLRESPRYVQVDLHDYEPNPKVTYPIIFEKVQKLIPEFRYTDLTIQIKEEKEHDLIRQDVKLSFDIDTARYTHTFFHDYRR